MNQATKYPLAQVIEVKQKRVEEAEKVVAEKKKQLEREQEKLKRAEMERDKVKQHYKDKLQQLRHALDTGTTTDKIQQMRQYLTLVEEKLAQEEDKVKKQKLALEQAEVDLKNAQDAWKQCIKEVDKLKEHRKLWTIQMMAEIEREEAKEQDELGSVIFLNNKRKYQ
jgi:flagellar biosynthesis chaperone FliJ